MRDAASAASVVPVLFKRALDAHQMTFALGEALAHLHALWYDERSSGATTTALSFQHGFIWEKRVPPHAP